MNVNFLINLNQNFYLKIKKIRQLIYIIKEINYNYDGRLYYIFYIIFIYYKFF